MLLNRILSAFNDPSPDARPKAFIYALIAFASLILKAQTDAQHLYFGRRASIRARLELQASIYHKALRRRDLSGHVDREGKASGSSQSTKKASKGGIDQSDKAGADIGKIVNLMSGDATTIAKFISGGYNAYGALLEIGLAGFLLYK